MGFMEKGKRDDRFYAAWATAWGPMGAVMGDKGLRRVILPHYGMEDLLALLAWEHPAAVRDDRPFEQVVALCRAYFNGQQVDFAGVACDLPSQTSFSGMVLRALRTIPYGQTRAYSAVAEQINNPDSARAVGTAVGKNPLGLVIPCHRVVRAGGDLGGFSAAGGLELKRRLLDLEKRTAAKPQ